MISAGDWLKYPIMSSIDWQNGQYTVPGTDPSAPSFRVTVTADWGALWDYETLMQEDSLAVYGDLLPIFRASDLNLVNVECALGEKGAPIKKGGPNLRGADGTVRALTEVPFHIGCLANNHIMDFGPESLEETIQILREAGVKTVGADMNGEDAGKPLVETVKGTTLGIINCAEGEGCASINGGPGAHPFDVPALQKQIAALKAEVDVVLVVFHGGREYAPMPPIYVVDGLRQLAEAGADVVVGHHPHVPQGIEIHNGVPIFYSQGNFVFRWADTRGENRRFVNSGYIVHLDFADKKLAGFALTPYLMKTEGVFQLQGEDKARLLADLEKVSGLLANPVAVQDCWNAFVDKVGINGMKATVNTMMNIFDTDEEEAAAKFHNLFFCPAHRELYLDGLKRSSKGTLGDSPQWAKDLVHQWGNEELS